MPNKSERRTQRCPCCGARPTVRPIVRCPVPPEVTERLVAFKRAHGVRWKAALCELWLQGQDGKRLRAAARLQSARSE